MTGRIHIVVGGQYGSEGKGALCARLADAIAPNSMVIRTGGPNAGHTAYDREGVRYQLRMIGTPAVRRPDIFLALGPRSVVDPTVLADECHKLGREVYVDPHATWLTERHIEAEQDPESLNTGSTRKGIGAARAGRIARVADTMSKYGPIKDGIRTDESVPELARGVLDAGGDVIVEGAQGFGLSLHGDAYPHVTSGDCTALDAFVEAGFNMGDLGSYQISSWVVLRPFPIRIAGESGPLQNETTWEALGLPTEYTTVTKKPRRVGDWDAELAAGSLASAGGTMANVCLTMVDQVFPAVAGAATMDDFEGKLAAANQWDEFMEWIHKLQDSVGITFSVDAIGTGPQTMVLTREAVKR